MHFRSETKGKFSPLRTFTILRSLVLRDSLLSLNNNLKRTMGPPSRLKSTDAAPRLARGPGFLFSKLFYTSLY